MIDDLWLSQKGGYDQIEIMGYDSKVALNE